MRRFIRGGLVALALICAGLPAATHAAEVTRWHYNGQSANAQFFSTDPSGCITTVTTVAAYDGRIKQDGERTKESMARVAIQQYDACTQADLLLANDETVVGPDAFQVDQQLQQATLQATIPVNDFVSGQTLPVVVSLTWSANGDAVVTRKRYHLSAPGLRITERTRATFQPAQASGTVSVAGGSNLTPAAAQNDEVGISKVKEGIVEKVY